MPRLTEPIPRSRLGLLALLLPAAAVAQGREVQMHLGRWWADGAATAYELRTYTPLGGPLAHGFGATALIHDNLGRNRAFYGAGYVITVQSRATVAPYGVAGAVLGLSTDTAKQALATLWSAGLGVAWRPTSWLGLAVEARYQAEDRGPRGFWRLRTDARSGIALSAGLAVAFGWSARSRRLERREVAVPERITGSAAAVVETALDALGAPYTWGGTAENGFDCSGLIQYAYGRYGIRLPRTSRGQARAGSVVPPVVDALRPGDILLFAAEPGGGVTHVGMYVGESKFIHSSTSGVRLSRLDPSDVEASWWLPRWVGARRIIE